MSVDVTKYVQSIKPEPWKPFGELSGNEIHEKLQPLFNECGVRVKYVKVTTYGPCVFVDTHDLTKMQQAHEKFRKHFGDHAISIMPA